MTRESRWLDELPLGSAERELLVAGKAARPSGDDVDASWRAFLVAASGTASAAASAGSAHALSAKAGVTSATKASAASLLSVATLKSFAVGIALGVGVGATGALVERVHPRQVLAASVARAPLARRARSNATRAGLPLRGGEPAALPRAPSAREQDGAAELSLRPAPHAAIVAAANPTPTVASGLAAPASASPGPSLSAQARELAQVKRLLDADATAEALRRLAANFNAGEPTALSEERDALYVQALARAGRGVEARALAREFLSRYPRSPYVASIRRLAGE